jgi:riboflavin kinase/FMN adenylyltransferase
MRIARGLESYPPEAGGTVVALGVFDGIHLGHQAILGAAVASARARALRAVACTFDPHPAEVLSPGRPPQPILTLDERLGLIASLGLDATVVLGFTKELAAVEPEDFVAELARGHLGAREIVVGYNHRFGRGARGDVRLLREVAEGLGVQTTVVAPLVVGGEPVSSSAVRAALHAGDVERAARLLGRHYFIAGSVVRGAGRGRQLGFPTANVNPSRPLLLPLGVYACRAVAADAVWPAAVNVGRQPTFGENALAIEAHLIDFSGDLYGRELRLEFVRRLRGEVRFPSVDALRAQIASDVALARRHL